MNFGFLWDCKGLCASRVPPEHRDKGRIGVLGGSPDFAGIPKESGATILKREGLEQELALSLKTTCLQRQVACNVLQASLFVCLLSVHSSF